MKRAEVQAKAAETKEGILKAAIQEFIRFGYYGARMQHIADAAGANKAMIYYYFSCKEQIYDEVIKTVIIKIISELNAIKEEPADVRKMILAIIEVYNGVFQKYPDYIRLLQYEIAKGGENLVRMGLFKMPDLPFRPKVGRIYNYFEKKMKEGRIRKTSIFQLIISIMSLIVLPFMAEPLYVAFSRDIPARRRTSFSKVLHARKPFIVDLIIEGILKRK
jgi:TetR/AcrR family transcriptional regulator